MKRLWLGLLCILALVAVVGVGTVAVASGAPEIGRCLASEAGKYSNSSCTKEPLGKPGKYEWHPGATGKEHFIGHSGPTEVWGGGSKHPIADCLADTYEGTVGPISMQTFPITYTGCESEGLACQTRGAPSGTIITTTTFENLLGVTKVTPKGPSKLGVSFNPPEHSLTLELFECGSLTFELKGGYIGEVQKFNRMLPSWTIVLKGTHAIQKPEAFVKGEKDVPTVKVDGGPTEAAGITSTETLTFEQPLELRDIG